MVYSLIVKGNGTRIVLNSSDTYPGLYTEDEEDSVTIVSGAYIPKASSGKCLLGDSFSSEQTKENH